MKNEQAVKAAFEYAAERYAAIGVDVNEVLKKMQGISLSRRGYSRSLYQLDAMGQRERIEARF